MATPVEITDSSFQNEVLDSDMPVLVEFSGDWCGPCRMIARPSKRLLKEYGDKIKVGKMDVDDNPMVPGRYGIVGIPL